MTLKPFLEVKNLNVAFPTEDGLVQASNDISFSVARGETLAVVGESGSGKSVTSLAVMGLHDRKRTQITGQAFLNLETGPVDVISADEEVVRKLRGKAMSMIFQDPMSALHPYYSIGNQLIEAWSLYNEGDKAAGKKRAIEMLDLVGIPDATKRVDEFPHQFSGGMRQRVMIAMALMNSPRLLIADEPTTALDVTVQAQILALLAKLKKEFDMGILLITHDLGVVAQVADRVSVMYGGQIVEEAPVDNLFYSPMAPYTLGLLKSVPRVTANNERLKAIPGQPPSLINLPKGCAFSTRCEYKSLASVDCDTVPVPLTSAGTHHQARCHIPADVRSEKFLKEVAGLK